MSDFYLHPSSIIDAGASIGSGTKIWHFSHICSNAVIGSNCSFGQNVMVGSGVSIGNNVKVQNNVSIYSGTTIEEDVFLGPSCVLTNVSNPRSQVTRRDLYEETKICRGASVGANATIVCGVRIGRYAFISAGAVVTKDVPDYALIMGVPGRHRGWISRHGQPLREKNDAGEWVCPESGYRYIEIEDRLSCLDLDEGARLPDDLAVGKKSYREFHSP